MFLGALYPAAPTKRRAHPRQKETSDVTATRTNRHGAHNGDGASIGIVDCRAAPNKRTHLAPMALVPAGPPAAQPSTVRLASSAPSATAHSRGVCVRATNAARSHSVVSAAATAALRDPAAVAVGDDEGSNKDWSHRGAPGRCLPAIDSGRGGGRRINWTQREMDMEEAESRLQIAALPDNDDGDDDDDASVQKKKGRRLRAEIGGNVHRAPHMTAPSRTHAARDLVAEVLPPSLTSPSFHSARAGLSAAGTGTGGGGGDVRGGSDAAVQQSGHDRAHPLWRFQASLLLTRCTPLYTAVLAPFCRLHTRVQLALSKADYLWDVLLAEEGLRGSLLQSIWEENAPHVHPLVWVMSTRSATGGAAGRVTTASSTTPVTDSPSAARAVRLPRLAGDAAKRQPVATDPHQSSSSPAALSGSHARKARGSRGGDGFGEITSGAFTTDSVCLRLLSDYMTHAKPSVAALLDDTYALLSQPPLKPLYLVELGHIFHLLAQELARQMRVMKDALQRLDMFAREKHRQGQARAWMLTVLRLCRDAAETAGEQGDGGPTSNAATLSVARPLPAGDATRESWASISLALQEPSVGDVQAWYDLVEALHTTGVASLKPEHVLDGLAAAMAPFAAPALLTVSTPSLVYGEKRAALSRQSSSARGKHGSQSLTKASATTATAAAITATEMTHANATPLTAVATVKEVDLALALYALHALGSDPSVFAQRDVTYALQEVMTLIQAASLLCESRRDEDDTYLGSTVRFAVANNTAKTGEPSPLECPSLAMREEVDALLTQLWDIGVYEVSSHFLRKVMRERAPRFQEALRRVHQTYTTGKPPRPELEVALAATFLKGCYSVLPSPPAPGREGCREKDKNSLGDTLSARRGPGATNMTETTEVKGTQQRHAYGAAQHTRQEAGRRLRNAYICTNVQRRLSSSFYLMAVCHEAVAQLREQAVVVLWQLFAPPGQPQDREGTRRRATSKGSRGAMADRGDTSYFLLSQRTNGTGTFAPALRRSSAALTPGYHLNDHINPLLLPNTPPPEDTLRWLEQRIQQRKAPRSALAMPDFTAVVTTSSGSEVASGHRQNSSLPQRQRDGQREADETLALDMEAPLLVSSPTQRRRNQTVAQSQARHAADLYDRGLVMDIFKVADPYRQLREAPETL